MKGASALGKIIMYPFTFFREEWGRHCRFSLSAKILLWVMPIVILGLLSLSLVAYRYINTVIEDDLIDSMSSSVGRSAESINRWFKMIMLESESIASTPAAKHINRDFKTFDQQNINRHKVLHKKHSDIFQDIYAANRRGEYHTVRQRGKEYYLHSGNIANRPYFIAIMSGGGSRVTTPLFSRTTGIPTIFMVSPILDNNSEPQGLIGSGISLNYIRQIVSKLKAGQSGYGFIIAKDGTYISSTDKNSPMIKKITEADNPSERELGRLMIKGGTGVLNYRIKETEMVAFYHPIPVSGWSVAAVIPASELFASAISMVRLLTLITIIVIFCVGISTWLTMQRLVQPLQILAKRTQEIAAGNLEGEMLENTSKDEIGILSESFNVMTDNLKRTVSGLKKSEDKYRGIFKNAIEGIIQTSLSGKILTANPAISRILHAESPESLISSYTDLSQQLYLNPLDRDLIISELFKSGSVYGQEVRFRCLDDEIIWVSLNAFLVKDEDGVPLHVESLVSDISVRKRAEEEREKILNQLMQSQKLEAVGQLAGGVAHDFNNMLSVILGRTQLALMKIESDNPLYKSFKDIEDAAEHSANLTRQLLAFARKQPVSPKNVDINEAISMIFSLLRHLITEDVELLFKPAKGVCPVLIDPDQLGQILTNLCVNAKDSIDGVGSIVIATEKKSFDSKGCESFPDCVPREYVCLSVKDTGSGMDEETQKHIFEPFYTTKGISKGTGLGLSTVYGIVKQNAAFIDINSKPGEGTAFKIYFPVYSGGNQNLEDIKFHKTTALSMGTVLLVEDDLRLLNISKVILEELGCRVLAASTPGEAIKYAEDDSDSIDLLITDVVMPEMNGRELASVIKQISPEISCLYMSGYTADIISHNGVLDVGINFIQKPFSPQDLAHKIREVMELKPS